MKKVFVFAWITLLSGLARSADAAVRLDSKQNNINLNLFAAEGTSTCAMAAYGTSTCVGLMDIPSSNADNQFLSPISSQDQISAHEVLFSKAVDEVEYHSAAQVENLMKHAQSDFERNLLLTRLSEIEGTPKK